MKSERVVYNLFVLFLTVSIISCATTTLTSVWKDENSQKVSIKKLLVFGVSDKPAIKRFFEDEFVKKLKIQKIEVIPSYAIIPSDKIQDKEFAQEKIKELRIDAILITRLVDKKSIETYYPPERVDTFPTSHMPHIRSPHYPPAYYYDWYGFYRNCYQCTITPGYKVEDEIISLETNLYDVNDNKLIWSALSDTFIETFDGGFNKTTISSFIDIIIKQLISDGLL